MRCISPKCAGRLATLKALEFPRHKEPSPAMQRDVDRLESQIFDLLVVGGGIQGAAIAWDGALRGLSVALIEQRDFGSGTTANSLRIAHGGLRAIQQFAVGKLRDSAREQAILFRIAPSQVRPLPCLVPIYRGSAPGVSAFRAAFASSRLLTADIQRSFRAPLPPPRVIGPEETRSCFGGFDGDNLAGGALWFDAQVPDIERLVLAFVRSAAERGAAAANYLRARRLVTDGARVTGVEATDQRTGRNLRIRSRAVINAAGPWVTELPDRATPRAARLPGQWAQGVNLVIDRPPPPVAIGVRSPWGPDRDPVLGGHRYLFMTGWKGATLAGTSYRFAAQSPSLPAQVRDLVDEWNAACPSLELDGSEVSQYHCGRLPLRGGLHPGRPTALLDHGIVVDHGPVGLRGLLSVVATKFTTARSLAEQAVDAVYSLLPVPRRSCQTADVELIPGPPAGADLGTRVRHGIREEMALSLEDLVVRRLGLGMTTCPPVEQLGQVADAAAREWGWPVRQTDEELHQLLGRFLPGGMTRAA
jgi:glycerol-3-phosphate dehydrogenase